MAAADHLEKNEPEGIEVRSLPDRRGRGRSFGVKGVEVLGRHVGQGATQQGPLDEGLAGCRTRTCLDCQFGRGCQIEVQQHRRAVARDQDVGWFQVPV